MLSARQHFPGTLGKVFLDAACCSLAPRPAVEAIEKFLGLAMVCPLDSSTHHHIFMDEMRAAARPAIARLINAHEDEIALVESTTHGLALAATAIPLTPGDRVLMPDLEFMQVALPWLQKMGLQKKRLPGNTDGIEIDLVPNRRGEILIEDIAARITPRTRVIIVSSVQWSHGYRLDLAALSRLCRERNLWLVVDAIQQLGAIPLDVKETPVDFLACGGHKWLNSPYGCGFLYINREALPRLNPPLAGYLSVEPPSGSWGEYFQTPTILPTSDFHYTPQARRYEHGGTANYPGAVGLAASLKLIEELSQANIAAHIYALTDRLIAGLDALNLEVVTPRARENRSGIVTFSVGNADDNVRLMNQLLAAKILVSVRYTANVGGIRTSCHFYNSEEDIDTLLAELKRLRSR
jgi:cysteine desulfurase / selenocysteine lyase